MSPFSIAGDVFWSIGNVFYWIADRAAGVPVLGGWFEDRFDDVGWFFMQLALGFYKLDEWWDVVWDFMLDIPNKIVNIWQYLIDKLEPVWDWFLNAGEWLWGQLTGVFDWITSFVGDAISAVKDWFTDTLPGYFADFGEWVWDQLDELDAIWESKWSPLKPLIDFWTWNAKQLVDFTSDPVGYLAACLEEALGIMLKYVGWPFLRVIEAFLVRIWDEEE